MNLLTPQIPESAPFALEQRAWINGYLAGLFAAKSLATENEETPALPLRGPMYFLYGSQTGSSENLARGFAAKATKSGFDAKAICLDDFAKLDLANVSRLAIITSTYGDGEFPDNAQAFWNHLKNGSAPRMENTAYSVLALGDTNYVKFCEAGKQFDRRLEELGAKRVVPRIDCDTDYDAPADAWFSSWMAAFGAEEVGDSTPLSTTNETGYHKHNPYKSRVKTVQKLNGPNSAKDTRHVEILLGDSGLTYEAGDALGVVPTNCPAMVNEILLSAGLDGTEAVDVPGRGEMPLLDALVGVYDLKPFITDLPVVGTRAEQLVAPLKILQPRLYSISSSPKAHPGEVHLTVGVVRYDLNGRTISGVCSTYLAERVVPTESAVPVFVHHSPGFRPPQNPSLPMIMVGPGTGIAPFRAFLEEREAICATGKNWLFFGDQKAECDFLYREQLETWLASGHLSRLDLAFSRDQADKIYVQDRMIEQAAELWSWLEQGAHFYVCGDASRMAKDVDLALHRVCELAGGLSSDDAKKYIEQMKLTKRYARDVY